MTNTNKWTKGPWKASKLEGGLWMVATEGDTICFGDRNHEEPDDSANFQLIAAAPKLVEALECAAAQLEADHNAEVAAEMFGGEPNPARAQAINRHDVAVMCRSALSLARGRKA